VTIIEDCTFEGNYASRGGGVFCYWNHRSFVGCTILDNQAEKGAGFYFDAGGNLLTGCLIAGNRAVAEAATGSGGAAYIGSSVVMFTNSTLAGNTAGDSSGGVACFGRSPAFRNCILWNEGDELSGYDAGDSIVSYSCVRAGWPGPGNIDATPEFVIPWDGTAGDFHLLPGSPCIDSGSNDLAVGILTDLDGNVRIWDGDDVPGAVVDMGAYEFGSGPFQPGDTNGNGVVDVYDLFHFSLWWRTPENGANTLCDRVDDGTIDEEDLSRLISEWR